MDRFNNEYGHHQDKDIVRQICNSGFRAIGSRRRFRVGNDRFQVYSIRRRERRAQRVNVPNPQGNDARRARRAQVVNPVPPPDEQLHDEQPHDDPPHDEQPHDEQPHDDPPYDEPIQEVPDTRSKKSRKKDPDYKGPKAKKIKTTGGDFSASEDPKDDLKAEEVVLDVPSESDKARGNIGHGESSGSLTKPEARRGMDSVDVSLRRLQVHLCNKFKESASLTGMFKELVTTLPSEDSPITLTQLDQKVREFMLELHFNKDDVAQIPQLDQGAIDRFNALPGMNGAFSFENRTIYLLAFNGIDENGFDALRANGEIRTNLCDPYITYLSHDKKNGYDVYKSELECLKSGKELNSSILNFYTCYLAV